MTTDQIERSAEVQMDALDRRLMSGVLSQREYDALVRKLNDWADAQYRNEGLAG